MQISLQFKMPQERFTVLNTYSDPKSVPEIMTPGRAFELRNSHFDWKHKTIIVCREDYERVEKPNTRGKVFGGSSCTHYHTWVRGSHASYDDWAEYGGETWDFKHCEPYFTRVGGP